MFKNEYYSIPSTFIDEYQWLNIDGNICLNIHRILLTFTNCWRSSNKAFPVDPNPVK